jgi:membrane protein
MDARVRRPPPPAVTPPSLMGAMGRALGRLWRHDAFIYVAGVSFYALLAIFPTLALLASIYSLMSTPGQAAAEASALTDLLPPDAQGLVQSELTKLASASAKTVTLQSALALGVGAYAAHRGIKALLAGLQYIYADHRPRDFVRFNLLAGIVGVGGFAVITLTSSVLLGVRVLLADLGLAPAQALFGNEWAWTGAAFCVGLTLLYRYAVGGGRIGLRASGTAGIVAALLSLAASWASAFYVKKIAHLGATYGSISAVVVFLIWLSWNVNAVLFGGALAAELELALERPESDNSHSANEEAPAGS